MPAKLTPGSEAGPPSDPGLCSQASPEQAAFYEANGYLKFGRIFTPTEMDALRVYVNEKIACLPEGRRPEEMDVPHFEDPWLFRYLAHPRVLDIVGVFLGPDIVLWSSHFIAKPGGDGRAVPWHTDGAFWQDSLEPMDVLTLWLAVDESRAANGCMRVLPGTHRAARVGLEAYRAVDAQANVFGNEIAPDLIDPAQAVDLELAPGECHFHDAWTLHGSSPNTSPNRRCGYTMRYMPANVVHHARGWSRDHKIYLLRGEDRTGGRNRYTPVPAH